MRVLTVGGAGFIGSHLTERLLAEGHSVDVVDHLGSGSLANLAEARQAAGELKIHTLDAAAAEFDSVVAMREPDVIYHLGLLPPGEPAEHTAATTLASLMSVLESRASAVHSSRWGVKVVVALSAVSLYGDVPGKDQPIKETQAVEPGGSARRGHPHHRRAARRVPRAPRRGVHRARRWPTCTALGSAPTVAWWARSPMPCARALPRWCTATAARPATSCTSTTRSTRWCERR